MKELALRELNFYSFFLKMRQSFDDFEYLKSQTCNQIQTVKLGTTFQEEFLKGTRIVHLNFLFCGSSQYARNKMNTL